jgi:hypothetical protein
VNRDTDLGALEAQLVLALRVTLSGQQADPLPQPVAIRFREAVRQLSALLADPADRTGGRETADRAVRECASAGWRTGLLAAQVLQALPALERAEERLRNRPERLRREMTGWLMLTRALAASPDSSSRFPAASMAGFEAIAEVSRLEEEMAVVTAIDLGAEAPALEDLVDAASALRLEQALARAAAPLLDGLAETVSRSMRAGRWDEVAHGRARYLRRWYQLSRTVPIPRSEALAVRPYLATCRLIGQNVGLMHHRAGVVSGALLLENFDERGVIGTFESSARNTGSPGDFVLDLLPLRFQLWGSHVEQFDEGYQEGYGDDREAAWIRLVMVDRLAQGLRDASDRQAVFPTKHLQLPHFVIRLAGHVLRTDPTRCPDFASRLQASEPLEADEQIQEATAVMAEAADLDENAVRWAADLVRRGCFGLTEASAQERALELLDRCISLTEDLVRPDLLYVLRGLQWAVRADGGTTEAGGRAWHRAATWFARDHQWAWARSSLDEALSRTRDPQNRAEILLATLRLCIDAARDTSDGAYAQQATEIDVEPEDWPDPVLRRLRAHQLVARSMITPDRPDRHALVREAIGHLAGLPDPDGFLTLINTMVPPWEKPDASAPDPLEALVPAATMEALYGTDPAAALGRLQADLATMQAEGASWPDQFVVAGRLALLAENLADQMPGRRQALAELANELAGRYREPLQAAIGQASQPEQATHPDQATRPDGDSPETSAANNIGLAAVKLHANLTGARSAGLLDAGIGLLELAVAARPAEQFPALSALFANNLALGYQSRAEALDGEDQHEAKIEELHRAKTLMDRVLDLDEQQVREGVPPDHLEIDLDHLNLGQICRDLGDATYEGQWIHRKSMDSGRWLRQAAFHFTQAKAEAAAAAAFARAGTAEMMLAYTATTVCERYLAERTFAGGDLQRAMYDWLCAVSGAPHVSTADFVQLCAGTAIAASAEAAAVGQEWNPGLLLDSIQQLIKLWNLAERRNGLPPSLARDIRMTILECLQRVKDAGLDQTYAEQMPGFGGLLGLLEASGQLDLAEMTEDPQYLARAHAQFQTLTDNEDLVVRALARPRARWLAAATSPSEATACGLSLRHGSDGLILRIPALARDVELGGLVAERILVGLTPTADVRELARFATGHLRLMMDWDPLPVTTAQATVTGQAGGTAFELQAAALPIPTWDTWLLRLTTSGSGPLRFRPGLPFLGEFDPASGRLDDAMPVSATDTSRVLLFGEQGLTLHVQLAADAPHWDESRLRLDGTATQPTLEVAASEVFLLLQATPRVSSSQVAFLVKADDDVAGAACASSFWPDMPDPGMPATGIQIFSALFPFQARVPSAALDRIRELPVTIVVMVGLPDDPRQLPEVLESLADPRREVLLVVDAGEFPRASAAADQLRRRVASSFSRRLLPSAASFGAYHESLSGIQVVQASRSLAPAAVQMLLDLAALRRVNPDDIPEPVNGRAVYTSTKGNTVGMRRAETLFTSPAGFDDLLARYRELGERSPTVVLGEASPIRQQLMALTPPRRPVLMLMPGDPAIVAAVPLARHLNAIILFASDDGLHACAQLAPADVYATPAAAARLPATDWNVHELPPEAAGLAAAFQSLTARDHADLLALLPSRHPELLANRELLAEMAPAGYVMLVTDAPGERPWAFLAANYAAALSAPVLVADAGPLGGDPRLPAAARLVNGAPWRERGTENRDWPSERSRPPDVPHIGLDILGTAGERLTDMAPRYLGFVTPHADFPIELMGDPPLATRYAVGRLAGPDLDSTALLIVRAALAEDVTRPAHIRAVVADAGLAVTSRPLPGARAEAAAIQAAFARQVDISIKFVCGEGDMFDFLAALPSAGLVHFAGHGVYNDAEPARSGLVFANGVLSSAGLLQPLAGTPIIFSNACQSGVLEPGDEGTADAHANSGWTGLAASFLLNGAANYLGSLWPIYDDSSRKLAGEFYELLCAGVPVGEALRRARLTIHAAGDPTWAAFVLFGCPRNRIRPDRADGAVVKA